MRILLLSGSFLPAAIIAGLVPIATRAQSEDSASTAATTVVGTLQEVVVTAQRRSESLQRAAIPVDVVGGDALTQANVTAAAQLTQLVPALTVQSAGGANTTFFVRGIGNFTVNGNSDPAIAFNYDGVYVGRPTSTSGVFYDLARIEVLKGPQGTLYGRNATAGAINVIPARPELGVFSGSAIALWQFRCQEFSGRSEVAHRYGLFPYRRARLGFDVSGQFQIRRCRRAMGSERWSVTAFVRNIEDERVVTSTTIYNQGALGNVVTTQPLTYGVRVATKF